MARRKGNTNESRNMSMVLQAFQNAGLSPNQARILAAEVGRENAFQDRYLWGYHKDPGNGAVNLGIISWQGTRGRNLEKQLAAQGLIKNGVMEQSQRALDAQARFLVNEIKNDPTYAKTKKLFLSNPNVDYNTGVRVLGKDFIRWRIDDPKYAAKGAASRDGFYRKLGGVAPQDGGVVQTGASAPSVAPLIPASGAINAAANTVNDLMAQNAPQSDLMGKNVLAGSVGFAVPETPLQNKLYGEVAEQGLPPQKESIAAVAADTISKTYDQMFNQPLVKSSSPSIDALMQIFNALEV